MVSSQISNHKYYSYGHNFIIAPQTHDLLILIYLINQHGGKDLIIINGRNVWPQDLESIAEQQPEVRTGDASAFLLPGANGTDKAVLLVQCRNPEKAAGSDLAMNIRSRIRREVGIDCKIELISRHTLPRTTSGKLSRSKARKDYIQRAARAESKPLDLMQDRLLSG